ncbi:MAG: hypothetical protein FK734_07095 [Asgard group archaeon]|nr:hypothetical protein [Asgard group archaeon]
MYSIFNCLKKCWRRRKAISSNVATILTVILALTFSAIIYFVVIPLLENEGNLIVVNYNLEDTNSNDKIDRITFTINNNHTKDMTITGIEFSRELIDLNWSLGAGSYILVPGLDSQIICLVNGTSSELQYPDLVRIRFLYKSLAKTIEIKIPAQYSNYDLYYFEGFEENETSPNWNLVTLFEHYSGLTEVPIEWIIEELYGNHYWQTKNNNCQFVTLNDPLMNLTNANISCDLRTYDDDANGIIVRYNNTSEYSRFYIIWYTEEHPSPRNGPHEGEESIFNWVTEDDIIFPEMLTIHYVEEDENGYHWTKIDEVKWVREKERWYTWRVITDGNLISIYIDNNPIPSLEIRDDKISSGYTGLISFANDEAQYDNLCVWMGNK